MVGTGRLELMKLGLQQHNHWHSLTIIALLWLGSYQ